MNTNRRGDGPSESSEVLDVESLKSALKVAQKKVKQAEESIEIHRRQLHAAQEETKLLEALIALKGGDPPKRSRARPMDTSQAKQITDERTTVDHSIVDEAIAVLTAAEQPLPISELMRLVQERGGEIPGAGTQANLISYLRRDGRVVRPSRGVYALAEWGFDEMAYVPKRRRRKRVRSQKRKSEE